MYIILLRYWRIKIVSGGVWHRGGRQLVVQRWREESDGREARLTTHVYHSPRRTTWPLTRTMLPERFVSSCATWGEVRTTVWMITQCFVYGMILTCVVHYCSTLCGLNFVETMEYRARVCFMHCDTKLNEGGGGCITRLLLLVYQLNNLFE